MARPAPPVNPDNSSITLAQILNRVPTIIPFAAQRARCRTRHPAHGSVLDPKNVFGVSHGNELSMSSHNRHAMS